MADIKQTLLLTLFTGVNIALASTILLGISLHHVSKAVHRRLWLFSSNQAKFLALNAATLALLGIATKPPKYLAATNEVEKLVGSVLLCAVMGACMPSTAAADLTDMWSKVAGVGLLVLTTAVNIFTEMYAYNVIKSFRFQHIAVVVSMVMIFSVLLTQAIALEAMMSDVKATVSEQLKQLHSRELRPGYTVNVTVERPWSWEIMEQDSFIKLMMMLTSDPQNVAARSPTSAIVGALVLFSVLILSVSVIPPILIQYQFLTLQTHFIPVCISIVFLIVSVFINPARVFFIFILRAVSAVVLLMYTINQQIQSLIILVCGFICVWRWLRVALHEDRPFMSLVSDAEPSYWRRKVNDFVLMLEAGPRVQPNVLEEGQYGFKEVLHYTIAFLFRCCIAPIHRILVALIRFAHLSSALLMRVLIIWPIQPLPCICPSWLLRRMRTDLEVARDTKYIPGVVCLAGEDAYIVQKELQGAAKLVMRRQTKRAKTTDMEALVTLLSVSTEARNFRNSNILEVLEQGGAPDVDQLNVEQYGYQYGWNLTAVSLLAVMTKIEVESLGMTQKSEATVDAYWQALKMVKVVDELHPPTVCSKETYLNAYASVWSKLVKKKRRCLSGHLAMPRKDPVEVLTSLLGSAEKHIVEFKQAKKSCHVAAPDMWSMQMVASYTMHTICKNLLRWWTDLESRNGGATNAIPGDRAGAKAMVEHTNLLMAEVLVGCLSSLPVALDNSMTEAVRSGQAEKIENAIFLVKQGKELWKKLHWPAPPPTETPGHLSQWLHLPSNDINSCLTNDVQGHEMVAQV